MLDESCNIEKLGQILFRQNLTLATAESCTGGLVAATITDVAGSSSWFERGFVTYSNLAKQQMLGVAPKLIEQYGPVSEQVAKAMAEGAVANSSATVSLAVTGIAGPSGGTKDQPVGTVWFAWKLTKQPVYTSLQVFTGDRKQVRLQATYYCLNELIRICGP